MSTALVVFVLVLLLPLFLASWRVSLVGLASQGAIMAWLAYDRDGVTTVADGVRLVDLGLVRSLIVPVALVMLLVARMSPAGADPTQLSTILRIHVSLATIGLALFALASALSIIYLLKDRSLRGRRLDTVSLRGGSGSLESLDRTAHVLIWIGFPIFTASMVLGAMWLAQQQLPMARPEYPLALTTWVCFATLLGARQVWGWRGRRSAKLTLTGFATALIVLGLYLVRRAVGG